MNYETLLGGAKMNFVGDKYQVQLMKSTIKNKIKPNKIDDTDTSFKFWS